MLIKDIPKIRVFENAYYQTYYTTKSMKTTFKYPEYSTLLDFTKFDKSSEKSKKIEYGAYQNVPPFTSQPIFIHFTHDRPLPLFKNVTRTITVSHWESI